MRHKKHDCSIKLHRIINKYINKIIHSNSMYAIILDIKMKF